MNLAQDRAGAALFPIIFGIPKSMPWRHNPLIPFLKALNALCMLKPEMLVSARGAAAISALQAPKDVTQIRALRQSVQVMTPALEMKRGADRYRRMDPSVGTMLPEITQQQVAAQ